MADVPSLGDDVPKPNDGDIKVLFTALKCSTNLADCIDFDQVARTLGLKNGTIARTRWRQVLKKHGLIVVGSTPQKPSASKTPSTTEAKVKKALNSSGKKYSLAPAQNDGACDSPASRDDRPKRSRPAPGTFAEVSDDESASSLDSSSDDGSVSSIVASGRDARAKALDPASPLADKGNHVKEQERAASTTATQAPVLARVTSGLGGRTPARSGLPLAGAPLRPNPVATSRFSPYPTPSGWTPSPHPQTLLSTQEQRNVPNPGPFPMPPAQGTARLPFPLPQPQGATRVPFYPRDFQYAQPRTQGSLLQQQQPAQNMGPASLYPQRYNMNLTGAQPFFAQPTATPTDPFTAPSPPKARDFQDLYQGADDDDLEI